MTITQTVDIPENRRLTIDVPREITTGKAVITFTPIIQTLPKIPETMLLSEASLAKDWDTPEEDKAWAGL